MPQGHGISDVVRRSIKDWMTDHVVDLLINEAQRLDLSKSTVKARFASLIRNSSQWVRMSRKMSPTGHWSRSYYSKMFGKGHVGLTILTNKKSPGRDEDMFIESVTITVAGRVIGGGKVNIPSARLSQKNKQVAISEFRSDSLIQFSNEELALLTAQLEFGEESMLALLEEERIV